MFIALSSFTIANDMAPEVRDAFVNRPHLVDSAPGFVKLNVMSPQENPNEIWLMTFWETEENFKEWYKAHYKEAHGGIPQGLKIVPGSVKVQYLNHISE